MVDERDDSVKPAGAGQGGVHATDVGPDSRPREGREQRTINEAPRGGEPPAGDQPPSPISGVQQSASGSATDIPNLGDEGGGSRYGNDDADDGRDENEYSGSM